MNDADHLGHDAAHAGLRDGAVEVVSRLCQQGHEALWAGGCVRDMVMGQPCHDYDIATSATPDQVMALFSRTVAVGASYGVVRVLLGTHEYEVATFRADMGYTDGRRPDAVAWASAREDVLRRDFTINGLLYDPLPGERGGGIVDHVGGIADLEAGIVRAIGDPDARIEEDKLRILRALRFAARFGFRIEEATWQAVKRRAAEVSAVSVERIREELERMLTEGPPEAAFRLLVDAGLLEHVLPEVPNPERLLARLDAATDLPPAEAWATVLFDAEGMPGAAASWAKRLHAPNALARDVGAIWDMVDRMSGFSGLDVAQQKRLVRRPQVRAALVVGALVVEVGQIEAEGLDAARAALDGWSPEELRPPQLMSGNDLVALGAEPGPGFAGILEAIEDAQLAGRCSDRGAALDLARSLLTT